MGLLFILGVYVPNFLQVLSANLENNPTMTPHFNQNQSHDIQ